MIAMYHDYLKCIDNQIVVCNWSYFGPQSLQSQTTYTNFKNVIINHSKYHLFKLHFIIYINQNITSYSYIMLIVIHFKIWHCAFKKMIAISQKITNDIHMKSWTTTSTKNMTHESYIPHHPKLWLRRIIIYII